MLGLHDRRKTREPNRFYNNFRNCIGLSFTRRQIGISKVLVHENFANSANDIALLRLGRK